MIQLKEIFDHSNDFIGREVLVGGWVRTLRNSKNVSFIELNDGSCFKSAQVVFDTTLENYDVVSKLSLGSSILVKGEVIESPGQGQFFEIHNSPLT